MKKQVEKILNEYQDREARAMISFLMCFNLLGNDTKYTPAEIKRAVYDTLDMLGVEE